MKFFLSVYHSNYESSVAESKSAGIWRQLWNHKHEHPHEVDGLMFELLRQFFKAEIFGHEPQDREHLNDWLELVQCKRNAIHAYRTRELGTFDEFNANVAKYLDFLEDLAGRLPDEPPSPDEYR